MSDKNDVRLLYQVLSSQIEFSKTQQWRIAYYTLLFIGGVVGASQLIYKDFEAENSWVAQACLFILAFIIFPLAMVCHQLIKKNEGAMCEARASYMRMWPRLSWPFNRDECTGEPPLVGECPRYTSGIYDRSIYDRIFWFPPVILTYGAGVFSYVYLILKLQKAFGAWMPWIPINVVIALVLLLAALFIYRGWDWCLDRKAKTKESKDTSLRSILKRIRWLVRWICTGQMPPRTHSRLHALVIECLCKEQELTETPHSSDP